MFFTLSKLFWILAAPGNLLALALCSGALLLFTRWRRPAQWLIGLVAAAVAVIAVIPVGQWLLLPLENRFPTVPLPEGLDGIVVLGGGINPQALAERGQADLNDQADRLFALAVLARRFPEAMVIYSGGDATLVQSGEREADGARRLMQQLGLDTHRIIFEREARNTFENAIYAKSLAKPGPGETWLLVTSAYHMPRSVGIFRRQGWPVVPYPVDYMTDGRFRPMMSPDFSGGLALLNRAVREWIGLAAYYARGYTDSLFPGPDATGAEAGPGLAFAP